MPVPISRSACAWLLLAVGCGTPLPRPILDWDGESPTLASYYHPRMAAQELPKTDTDCRDHLRRSPEKRDSLVAAICHLNRQDWDSASAYARAFDSCSREVVKYDIAVGMGLPKGRRFETLQSLLDCSENSRYRKMIKGRSKLAHYE